MGDDGRKATEVTMNLDRNELARALSAGRWWDAADMIARLRPATVAPVADAAPAPSATAAKGSDAGTAAAMPDATDPRRTVGAVVRDEDSEYAVILSGDGQAQRPLHLDATTDPRWFALDDDEFVRWATRAECEKHGIPYVERGAAPSPAAAPDHPTAASFAARRGQGAAGDQRVAAGLDAPAFDESSERETAVDIAKDRGLDVAEEVGFVAGWLARARIAANGGVA